MIDPLLTSDSHDWGTPQDFFDELNTRFHFTLDVCASPWNAKCKDYYSENGLEQEWKGVCWMNPPYGREIGKWMKKAYEESKINNCTVVCLVPARTDTKWWWDYALKGSIEHVKGRLKFSTYMYDEMYAAPFPSAVVIFDSTEKKYVLYGDTKFIKG